MRLLLDTNAIIWWDSKSSKLSKKAEDAIRDTSNEVFISVVNAWEMQIKAQIGKLKQNKPWRDVIREQIQVNGFPLLRPELSHIEVLDSLPFHHKDPFDRLLIAQAIYENLTLVSNDPKFPAYPVTLLW